MQYGTVDTSKLPGLGPNLVSNIQIVSNLLHSSRCYSGDVNQAVLERPTFVANKLEMLEFLCPGIGRRTIEMGIMLQQKLEMQNVNRKFSSIFIKLKARPHQIAQICSILGLQNVQNLNLRSLYWSPLKARHSSTQWQPFIIFPC